MDADTWRAGLHDLHCREDRCALGCNCPCHRGEDMSVLLPPLSPLPSGHFCLWEPWRRQEIGNPAAGPSAYGKQTLVLLRCSACGDMKTAALAGAWTWAELTRAFR